MWWGLYDGGDCSTNMGDCSTMGGDCVGTEAQWGDCGTVVETVAQ